MKRIQINLKDGQRERMAEVARRSGAKSRSEVYRLAVEQFLAKQPAPDWRERLGNVKAVWKDREDIDQVMKEIRGELNRGTP